VQEQEAAAEQQRWERRKRQARLEACAHSPKRSPTLSTPCVATRSTRAQSQPPIFCRTSSVGRTAESPDCPSSLAARSPPNAAPQPPAYNAQSRISAAYTMNGAKKQCDQVCAAESEGTVDSATMAVGSRRQQVPLNADGMRAPTCADSGDTSACTSRSLSPLKGCGMAHGHTRGVERFLERGQEVMKAQHRRQHGERPTFVTLTREDKRVRCEAVDTSAALSFQRVTSRSLAVWIGRRTASSLRTTCMHDAVMLCAFAGLYCCLLQLQHLLPAVAVLFRQSKWREAFQRWKIHRGVPEGSKVFIMRGGYTFIRSALLSRGWCAATVSIPQQAPL
jgi:hypothetical protein